MGETRHSSGRARGYFEIGIFHPKTGMNVGTLWRSAMQMGAAGVFTIGRRYARQSSDTCGTERHIPLRHSLDWDAFVAQRPIGAQLVGIEMGGRSLAGFTHPDRAIYLLGAEDHGLPDTVLATCQSVVSIESVRQASYNVAVAGSLVMYHRLLTRGVIDG